MSHAKEYEVVNIDPAKLEDAEVEPIVEAVTLEDDQ